LLVIEAKLFNSFSKSPKVLSNPFLIPSVKLTLEKAYCKDLAADYAYDIFAPTSIVRLKTSFLGITFSSKIKNQH